MTLPIQLISTDFDGTLFAEFENPPISLELQGLLRELQSAGARWVINTGRDLSSLLECVGRAHLSVRPDYLVVVERDIYVHEGARYVPVEPWNERCRLDHERLFAQVRRDLPALISWVNAHYDATVYEDAFSPFCLIAASNEDADEIMVRLDDYCRRVENLTVMRNDVYARFCHAAYTKGTALAEIARRLQIGPQQTFAAGDHFNDLPMLDLRHARWLTAPANSIETVKQVVRQQGGHVSSLPRSAGVHSGLRWALSQANPDKSSP